MRCFWLLLQANLSSGPEVMKSNKDKYFPVSLPSLSFQHHPSPALPSLFPLPLDFALFPTLPFPSLLPSSTPVFFSLSLSSSSYPVFHPSFFAFLTSTIAQVLYSLLPLPSSYLIHHPCPDSWHSSSQLTCLYPSPKALFVTLPSCFMQETLGHSTCVVARGCHSQINRWSSIQDNFVRLSRHTRFE